MVEGTYYPQQVVTEVDTPELDAALQEQLAAIDAEIEEVLFKHGAQTLLARLGAILQSAEGAGNGHYVGQVLEALSNIDW